MDIPIHVQNGDTTVVRFEGCGLRATELISKNILSSSESVVSEQGLLKRPVPEQVRASLVLGSCFHSRLFKKQPIATLLLLFLHSWCSCQRTVSLLVTSLFAQALQDSSSWSICPIQTLFTLIGTKAISRSGVISISHVPFFFTEQCNSTTERPKQIWTFKKQQQLYTN